MTCPEPGSLGRRTTDGGHSALRASSHVSTPRPLVVASLGRQHHPTGRGAERTKLRPRFTQPGSMWSSWLAGRGRGGKKQLPSAFHLCLGQRLKMGCLAGGRCAQVSSRETIIGGLPEPEPWGAWGEAVRRRCCRNSHRAAWGGQRGSGSCALQAVGACWGTGLRTCSSLSHKVRPEAQPLVPDPAAAAGARGPVRVRRGRLHLCGGGPRLPQRSDCRGALRPRHQLLGLRGPAQEGGKEAPRGTPPRFTEWRPGQAQDKSPLVSTSCALSLGGGSQRRWERPLPEFHPLLGLLTLAPGSCCNPTVQWTEAFPLPAPWLH